MNAKILFLSVLAAASTGFAGQLNLEMRSDLTSTTYNDAALAASASNKSNYMFNLQSLKLDGKGSLSDSISFRLKLLLNKPSVVETKRETANNWAEMAYLTNKVNDLVTVTAGKFNSEIGGWEANTARTDLYMVSQGFNEINGLRYHDGLKVGFNFGEENNLALEVTNQEADSLSGTKLDQNRSVYGAVYKGSFLDKSLMPIVSYFNSPLSTGNNGQAGSGGTVSTTTDSATNTYSNLGLRWTDSIWTADIDYGMVTKKEVGSANVDHEITNTVAKLSYKIDSFTPAVKWFGAEDKTKTTGAADSTVKYDGAEFSVDYKPVAEQNLRYHLAYSMVNTKPNTGDTQTTTSMVAGLTLYADFLK
jgi:hypothetical protein